MTRAPRLSGAVSAVYERAPGVEKAAAPLVESLLSMARKPYEFHSFHERRLFVKKPLTDWAGYLYFGVKRRFVKRPGAGGPPKRPEGVDIEGVTGVPHYERKLLDLDFIRYLFRLYRFDRRIGYKIKVSEEIWVDRD
jgi:hypothetical protein